MSAESSESEEDYLTPENTAATSQATNIDDRTARKEKRGKVKQAQNEKRDKVKQAEKEKRDKVKQAEKEERDKVKQAQKEAEIKAREEHKRKMEALTQRINDFENQIGRFQTEQTFGGSGGMYSRIPVFHGNLGDNFSEWFEQFELHANSANWSADERKRILPTFLKSSAFTTYRDLTDVMKNDYVQLQTELKRLLQPAELSRFQGTELNNRIQKLGEPVDSFAHAIQKLTRGAYPNMPTNSQNDVMRERFLAGLHPELKKLVFFSDPTTFMEAVNLARKHEAQSYLLSGTTPTTQGVFAGFSSNTNMPAMAAEGLLKDTIDGLKNELAQLRQSKSESQSRTSGSQQRQNTQFRPRNNYNNSPRQHWTNDGRPICNFCRKPGHIAANCRSRNQGQNQQQNSRYSNQFQNQGYWGRWPQNPPQGMQQNRQQGNPQNQSSNLSNPLQRHPTNLLRRTFTNSWGHRSPR